MIVPRDIVAARPIKQAFIIWPRPEIQQAWRAELTQADGDKRQCGHNHSREDLAEKCGRREIRLSATAARQRAARAAAREGTIA